MKKNKIKFRLVGYLFSFISLLTICSPVGAQERVDSITYERGYVLTEEVKLRTPKGRKVWVAKDSTLFEYLDRGYERVGKSRIRKMRIPGKFKMNGEVRKVFRELIGIGIEYLHYEVLGAKRKSNVPDSNSNRRIITPGIKFRYRF